MKHSWLFMGLLCLFARWCPSIWVLGSFLIVSLYFYLRHFHIHPIAFIMVGVLLATSLLSMDQGQPSTTTLQIKEIKSNYVIASDGQQRILVYGVKNAGFDDTISVKGSYEKIDTIHNINEFSFMKWLARRGVHYQIQAREVVVVAQGKSLRHIFYDYLQHLPSKEAKDWVVSMLFQIHEEELSYFITSSGMHLSLLGYFIERHFKRFLSKQKASLFVLCLLLLVGMLTVFSSSLIRILIFRMIAMLYPQDSAGDRVGRSMCVLLLLFPYMAYEFAFLLPVAFRFVALFQRTKANRILLSFGVMIPFQFLYFHACDLLAILLFRWLRPCYAILYVMAWGYVFLKVELFYTIAMKLQGLLAIVIQVQAPIYYAPSLLWLMAWGWYFMHDMTYHKKSLVMVLLFVYTSFASYLDPFGEIVMMDVGQGDCTLIKLPFHQGVLLIDVMGSRYKNIPKDIIVPQLHARGITSIDKVILTHEDYDHSGGLKELQELIEVKEVVRDKREDTWLGALHIPFLLPQMQSADRNDNSLLTYLEVYGLHILFMGDAGMEVEEEVMENYQGLKVDILKVGHHGSATSSSLAFLHQLDVRMALISAGRKNRYGHPSESTLRHLAQEDILALTTSRNGGVSIKFCKYFAFFKTADNEFGIIEYR